MNLVLTTVTKMPRNSSPLSELMTHKLCVIIVNSKAIVNLESAQINQDITLVNVGITPLVMAKFVNQNVGACTKVTSTTATKKTQVGFDSYLIISDSDWSRNRIGKLVQKPSKSRSGHFL